jgi:hypothetical protein
MAKTSRKQTIPLLQPDLTQPGYFPFTTFRNQLIFLLVVGFSFYANSIWNEYALDDGVMIKENTYVLQGTSGLKKIFSEHSMKAFYEKNHARDEFAGGRYRPLSIATFAIEQSAFGMNPGDAVEFEDDGGAWKRGTIRGLDAFYVDVSFIGPDGVNQTAKVPGERISTFHTETKARHLSNVCIYLLTISFLLYFLREQVFRSIPDLGFLCVLIFAIHPIHTEVVDNVKSRDELMALLFAILTFVFAFMHMEKKNTLHLFLGVLSLFLALLSKEYGVVMFGLLPLFFYQVMKKDFSSSLIGSLPYFGGMLVYFIIRFNIIPPTTASSFHASEVLNNQYIAASGLEERLATKIYVLSRYLWLQMFPVTLCVDYSYNQIPFITFKNWMFFFSLIVHLGIAAGTLYLFLKRHVIGFFLLFYLAHLFLISNLMVEIGTTLGERLIYLPSCAFCIIAGYGLYRLIEIISSQSLRKFAMVSSCAVLLILCSIRVISRNRDWKNDKTLFTHDLAFAPNSILVNGNAGKAYIDMSNEPENKAIEQDLVKKSIAPLRHAISLHPTYLNGYLNLGVAYFKLGMLDSTYANWLKGHELAPNNTLMHSYAAIFMNRGLVAARKNNMTEALAELNKAALLDQNNADIWANLGGAYYTLKQYEKAKSMWENALRVDPNHVEAKRGYQALTGAVK